MVLFIASRGNFPRDDGTVPALVAANVDGSTQSVCVCLWGGVNLKPDID